jgi:polysaccharide export outer membrane protein
MAGGLTPFAEEDNIKVIRRTNGKETVFPFHYARIRKGNDLDLNIVLKSGDIVLVP